MRLAACRVPRFSRPPAPGLAPASDGASRSGAGGGQATPAQAGLLTAGSWDDNLNFARYVSYLQDLQQAEGGYPSLTPQPRAPHARSGARALDLAFVLDTTGSMSDELAYLLLEVEAIVGQVKARYEGAQVRLALVVYRDDGDAYVTRTYDFTSNVQDFRATLAQQSADGGGDEPEAMERGLGAAQALAWRGGDAVQILFHIADAAPHQQNYGALLQNARALAARDVVMFPIAASGGTAPLEYLMRAMAQMSGGRYVFLTDDSGVRQRARRAARAMLRGAKAGAADGRAHRQGAHRAAAGAGRRRHPAQRRQPAGGRMHPARRQHRGPLLTPEAPSSWVPGSRRPRGCREVTTSLSTP